MHIFCGNHVQISCSFWRTVLNKNRNKILYLWCANLCSELINTIILMWAAGITNWPKCSLVEIDFPWVTNWWFVTGTYRERAVFSQRTAESHINLYKEALESNAMSYVHLYKRRTTRITPAHTRPQDEHMPANSCSGTLVLSHIQHVTFYLHKHLMLQKPSSV